MMIQRTHNSHILASKIISIHIADKAPSCLGKQQAKSGRTRCHSFIHLKNEVENSLQICWPAASLPSSPRPETAMRKYTYICICFMHIDETQQMRSNG